MLLNSFLVVCLFFLLNKASIAQCPVCVVTVGGGLLLGEYFGISKSLLSIWISGLNTVLALWLGNQLKSGWFINRRIWIALVYLTISLYYFFSPFKPYLANDLFIFIATLFSSIILFKSHSLAGIRLQFLWTFIFYLFTVIFLTVTNDINDQVMIGLLLGLLAVIGGLGLDKFTRYKNKNKILFPYQKVVFPLLMLILTHTAAWLLL